jgi:hypothetical protein
VAGEEMTNLKIQTLLIEDLDGSEAEGTVRFGWTVPSMRST